jgi:hypothetical protein
VRVMFSPCVIVAIASGQSATAQDSERRAGPVSDTTRIRRRRPGQTRPVLRAPAGLAAATQGRVSLPGPASLRRSGRAPRPRGRLVLVLGRFGAVRSLGGRLRLGGGLAASACAGRPSSALGCVAACGAGWRRRALRRVIRPGRRKNPERTMLIALLTRTHEPKSENKDHDREGRKPAKHLQGKYRGTGGARQNPKPESGNRKASPWHAGRSPARRRRRPQHIMPERPARHRDEHNAHYRTQVVVRSLPETSVPIMALCHLLSGHVGREPP